MSSSTSTDARQAGRDAQAVTRRTRLALFAAALAALAGPSAAAEPPARDKAVGRIEFRQVQMALVYGVSVGGGTLRFEGRAHPFGMGGLGVGGIGVSRIEARGEVHGLTRLEDIEGAYAQVLYGAVAGDDGLGERWLRNASGVEIRLQSTRRGFAPSLGGDAVHLRLD